MTASFAAKGALISARRLPDLKLVVTSRVRLRLSTERESPALPLPVSDPAADAFSSDELEAEAVRLIANRARAFIGDLVRRTYADKGLPSIVPVAFFKLQLVLLFEGLRSERQLMRVVAERRGV